MKVSWGWKAGLLYTSFVVMMVSMVVASSRQKIDLVSKDYYKDEIEYQGVIDAGRNQSQLLAPLVIRANDVQVTVDFPDVFKDKVLKGEVYFYSPVNDKWDYRIELNTDNNRMSVDKNILHKTIYAIKIKWETEGKNYYQETSINLN